MVTCVPMKPLCDCASYECVRIAIDVQEKGPVLFGRIPANLKKETAEEKISNFWTRNINICIF